MNAVELLTQLCQTPGISGHEKPVRDFLVREVGPTADETLTDNLGSVIFRYNPTQTDRPAPKILFLAHTDEIGFLVADIKKDGYLKLEAAGGWNPPTLPGSPVEIINTKGERIFGIVGAVPVHHLKGSTDKMEVADLFVDIGAASAKEVDKDFHIRLGSPVVPLSFTHHDEKKKIFVAKALDDRAGVAALVDIAHKMNGIQRSCEVYLGGSVQEEVGCRGASVITGTVQPDLCVIVEAPPADDLPGFGDSPQMILRDGIHIRVFDPGLMVKPAWVDFAVEVAEKNDIDYQLSVRRRGGTDGREVQHSLRGVPTIVIGVPVRYAHSHHGMLSLKVYDQLVKFIGCLIEALDDTAAKRILD